MIARIGVTNLGIYTIIGINRIERIIPQKVLINLQFDADTGRSSRTDSIDDTVNYRTLVKTIIREVRQARFNLLEKLADHILNIIKRDERIVKALVRVDKPGALRYAKSVYIEVAYDRASDQPDESFNAV